ncbi:MAG: sensor histidine kinase, partial [Deltaproteobacteria bacterium]
FNTLPAHALPRFRGACRSAGFVFVAITPIRYGDHIIGLIHFADRKGHPGLQKKVAAIEVVTSVVGEGVRKFELEERIKRESATLEGFFAHTITPLVILDKDFNFVRVNEAYAKACQRRPGDFVGRNHFELYPSAENELIFREVVRTKTPHQAFAKAFLFPDHPEWGTTYWNWTLVPMLDDSGAVECLVFSLNDVTAVTRAREELRRKERELADARRLADVGTLAATVAHELRNPLAAIRMAAYNIRRKAANPALSGHLENIEAKIEDSEQIITNLLFYSRMRPPVFAPVALESLLEECLREVEHRHGNNGAAVLRRFEDLADVTIEADAVQMKELFSNLLNNAFEALEGGKGMVEVAAGRENNMLRVAVRDSGRGIAAHNLERIFEPFFSDKARGTGLGLTVSRQIAVFHGGEIRVASREGAGTTVTVSLPIERGGVHGR